MAVYKRGDVYWFEFVFKGQRVRVSTGQGSKNVAVTMESAYRTKLAMEGVGIVEKEAAPTLERFIKDRFEPWAKAQFETTSPKTWNDWYRPNLKAICAHEIAKKKMDEITSEDLTALGAFRLSCKLKVASVNSTLRVARRVLKIAAEWGIIPACPKVKLLRGEAHRERVVTPEEEAKYLAAAPGLLADVATVLFDTGFRPEECFRLRWECVNFAQRRVATLFGKTGAARRTLPMTNRVKHVLKARWEAQDEPREGFVFPAPTREGHINSSSVKKQHNAALAAAKLKPFVLYSIRHTFLTRLATVISNPWEFMRLAGHSSIQMSLRYVHVDENRLLEAMGEMSPHKSPHSGDSAFDAFPAGLLTISK